MRMYVTAYPAHCVDCSFTQLVLEVISLDETNTVLPGDSALHLHSAFHHAVHDSLRYSLLTVAEEDDRYQLLAYVECRTTSGLCQIKAIIAYRGSCHLQHGHRFRLTGHSWSYLPWLPP